MIISRTARIGGACWLAAVSVLVAGVSISGLDYRQPDSWAARHLSGVSSVACAVWDPVWDAFPVGRTESFCSPSNGLMSTAFVVAGVLMALGILLIARAAGRGSLVRAGQGLLLLTALAYAWVAALPPDADAYTRSVAQLPVLVLGNTGLIVAGYGGGPLGRVRVLSLVAGLTGVAGAAFHFAGVSPGIPGLDPVAVAVFPLWVWALVAGVVLVFRPARPTSKVGRTAPVGSGIPEVGCSA
jgi:hypothetical protein